MALWATASVEQQPTLTLVRWRIMRLPDRSIHLVGYCVENDEGRVSSAVVSLDVARRRASTGSGRVYELSGPPGVDGDAEYVWQNWVRLSGVHGWHDATADILEGV